MHSLNIRNVSEDLMQDLKRHAMEHKMHLREYCIMLLEEGMKTQSRGEELVEAITEVQVTQGMGITGFTTSMVPKSEISPVKIDPVAFEFSDFIKKETDKASGAEPTPPAPASVKPVIQMPKTCPKCKREKLKPRDETTLRCSLCGYQEAR